MIPFDILGTLQRKVLGQKGHFELREFACTTQGPFGFLAIVDGRTVQQVWVR